MKNRVLSVLLSISIICSNFSTGFVVIAEGDEPTSTETTETIEPTNDSTEGSAEDDMINSDSNEEPSEDGLAPDSDDNDLNDGKTIIKVSQTNDLVIYNGQDPNYIYNFKESYGATLVQPRYVGYFSFITSDNSEWSDDLYNHLQVKFEERTGNEVKNEKVYSVSFVFTEPSFQDKYTVECLENYTLTASNTYHPNDVIVKKVPSDSGKVYLKCETEGFLISNTNDESSFTSNQVAFSSLEENKYYLKNVESDSLEYNSISSEYIFDNENVEMMLSEYAVIKNVDLLTTKAINQNVTIDITAYALADKVKVSLWNDGTECFVDKEVVSSGELDENTNMYIFKIQHTFEAKSDSTIYIKNLKAILTVDNKSQEKSLKLRDSNENIYSRETFVIEVRKPVDFRPEWNHDRDDHGKKVIPFVVSEYETEIVKVEYHYDNEPWKPINNINKNGNQYSFDFRTDYNSLFTKELYLRATDAAGNERYCIRTKNLNDLWLTGDRADNYKGSSVDTSYLLNAIDSIELWYSDEMEPVDADWVKITNSSTGAFCSYPFGNAINKEWFQIRVISESETDFFVNSSKLAPHKIAIDTDDDGENDKTVVDYYYYNIKSGTDCYAMISVKDKDNVIYLETLADKMSEDIDIKSSYIVVENTNPIALLERPDFAATHVSVSNKWYGIKERDEKKYFEIEVTDEKSGIKSISITNNGTTIEATEENPIEIKINESQDPTKITGYLSQQAYDELAEATTNVKIKIPIALFDDGDHVLEIKVVDNAGNSETGFVKINGDKNTSTDTESEIITNKLFTFSTDFTRPTGVITIASEPKTIGEGEDKKAWFAASDAVEFEFAINDTNPNEVIWKANSNAQSVEMDYPAGETNIKASLNDTTAALDENNSYTISAVFYDQAGNSSEDGSIGAKTFYKDTQNPEIDTVSVSCAPEKGIDKIFRILTFGIFAKDTIMVYVTAHDGEHDSGLNDESLEISLDDGETYNKMTFDEGKYKYQIKATETPTSGIIALRVTDQFGNYSEKFDVIIEGEGAFDDSKDETGSKDFVVETKAPNVKVTIPTSDGITRTDGNIWYNSDKDIIIEVQDEDSGIRNIHVFVNEVPVYSDSDNVNFISECIVKDTDKHKYRLSTEPLREILRNSNKLPDDGRYTIKIKAEDNAGNENTSIALTVGEATSYTEKNTIDYYLDYDDPVVQKIDFSIPSADEQNDADVSEYITELEYGYYFKTAVLATVNIEDQNPTSDLHRIEYVLVNYNNGTKGDEYSDEAYITINAEDKTKGTATFDIPANFKGQILVTAYDYVQNESKETAPDLFVVDTSEKHESENHIEITGMGETAFTDAKNHPLFARDVELTVRVSDTMSGIREINYALDSEKNTQDVKTITIQNSGYSVGQNIGDGWIIKSMDENLVTEVERVYIFSEDNNNIKLTIGMKDRAKNESSKPSDVFTVDQTAPIINVTFDNPDGNADCYQGDRTATIKVVERNFDPAKIMPNIQNTYGGVPSISSFKDDSNTEHIATIKFEQGDYKFAISGTDRCDHSATVNYTGGNEQAFRVDKTDPVIVHNFDQLVNDAENSFNSDKEVTITITEHNFAPELVAITIYRVGAGQPLTVGNRQDCTKEYIDGNNWSTVGNDHTISFIFSSNYVYQVIIGGMDESGRKIPECISPVFEIDKIKPVLKAPANMEALIYTNDSTIKSIEFMDSNIAKVKYSVVSYRMKVNEEKIGYDVAVESKNYETMNNTVTISDEFFNQDGIYEVKCVPYDVAGNAGEETTHTYVIQREADFLVYIPNSNKKNQTGLYKFDRKGIRSADFEDIEIVSYLTKDKAFTVEIDGVEIPSGDASSEIVNENINQVNVHRVIVKSSYIAQNFSEDTVDTDLTLNAVASDGNDSQIITLGHIYIDNVKPVGEYEKALQDIGFFDGFYGVESRTLMIEGVSPDIDLGKCEIMVNDELLTYENGGLQYDEDSHIISFTVDKGYTSIRTTLVDNAGNTNSLAMIKKVYVGGLFARWWYLFILGGLVVLAIPTYIIFMIIRKKRSRVSF